MLVGQGLNLLLQAGYFVLLARLLGVKEYGVFVGAFALVSIATPYSALGSGLLFMQYVSTKAENFAVYWGNILLSTLVAGLPDHRPLVRRCAASSQRRKRLRNAFGCFRGVHVPADRRWRRTDLPDL